MSGVDLSHALLPQAWLLPLWVKFSWAVVLSAVVLRLCAPLTPRAWPAALLGILMLVLPGAHTSGYLALVFQTPSGIAVAWALGCWVDALQQRTPVRHTPTWLAAMGALLGWGLLVDTFHVWPAWVPLPLYALGFESFALWAVLLIVAAATLWQRLSIRQTWVFASVLLAYGLLRLPTGNLWDALLDPFVWVVLHVQLWRTWRMRAAGA